MMKNTNPKEVYLIIDSQIYPVMSEVTTVGRKLSNGIVIQNEVISREHAVIRYEHSQFVIYDKQSTGGTFVNNKRVDRCVLYSGDVVTLAGIQMMFVNNSSHLRENESAVTKSLQ
jgi:pSer/pThr/pTyr-binding forkhead associated (FHA) protein